MTSATPKRLNPNAPVFVPLQPKQPPSPPSQTVQIWTPHHYHHYPLIPTVDYQLFCYYTHPPEIHSPPVKELKTVTRVLQIRNKFVGCRRRKKMNQHGRTRRGGVGGVCTTDRSAPVAVLDACDGTTVMIRNIPNQFNRPLLMEFLDKLCYRCNSHRLPPISCKYDFLYLPMDFGSGLNLGYAFVNFTNSAAARWIKEILDGYKWGVSEDRYGFCSESNKVCCVTQARVQGKENLIKHFRSSLFECHTADYLPVILSPPRDGTTTFSLPSTVGRHTGFYR